MALESLGLKRRTQEEAPGGVEEAPSSRPSLRLVDGGRDKKEGTKEEYPSRVEISEIFNKVIQKKAKAENLGPGEEEQWLLAQKVLVERSKKDLYYVRQLEIYNKRLNEAIRVGEIVRLNRARRKFQLDHTPRTEEGPKATQRLRDDLAKIKAKQDSTEAEERVRSFDDIEPFTFEESAWFKEGHSENFNIEEQGPGREDLLLEGERLARRLDWLQDKLGIESSDQFVEVKPTWKWWKKTKSGENLRELQKEYHAIINDSRKMRLISDWRETQSYIQHAEAGKDKLDAYQSAKEGAALKATAGRMGARRASPPIHFPGR